AFATLFPHRVLYLFFLPIEPRVKTLLWLGILISVIGMVLPPKGIGVAHCAHLGGLLVGLYYIRSLRSRHQMPSLLAAATTSRLKVVPVPK
ncbi:MAG: Rhomboid family protein, partial [Pedosphaera sp.]|nr:Rhomboid family protein [Pedosphaera sp.]